MPFNFDTSNPADDGIVSQFPANERALRAAIQASFNVEHASGTGHHKIPYGDTTDRDNTSDWPSGAIFYNTDLGAFQITDSPSPSENWITISDPYSLIPQGTVMLFVQASAPTGWTKITTYHDKLLRVVNSSGAGTGGTWNISGFTIDNHTLTVDEIPAHTHGGAPGEAQGAGGGSAYYNRNGVTESTGGGQGHSHGFTATGTWRPEYVNCIFASKD